MEPTAAAAASHQATDGMNTNKRWAVKDTRVPRLGTPTARHLRPCVVHRRFPLQAAAVVVARQATDGTITSVRWAVKASRAPRFVWLMLVAALALVLAAVVARAAVAVGEAQVVDR